MMMRPFLLILLGSSLGACVGDPPAGNTDSGKAMGDEGGPCFANFTCNSGLVCDKGPNICRQADGSATIDTGTDGGSGSDADMDATVPCMSGAVSYWPGEMTGQDSVGKLHFTPSGNLGYANAKIGKGFVFSESMGDVLRLPSNAFGGITTFTFEFWLFHGVTQAGAARLMHYVDGTDILAIDLGTAETLTFEIKGPPALGPTASITGNTWHHLAFVATPSTMTIYVDAKLLAQQSMVTVAFPPATNAPELDVGRDKGGGAGLAGTIDEIGYWSRALPVNDLKILASGSPVTCRLP